MEEYSGMEQPPLIKQLKTILAEYPDDGQIIKVGTFCGCYFSIPRGKTVKFRQWTYSGWKTCMMINICLR